MSGSTGRWLLLAATALAVVGCGSGGAGVAVGQSHAGVTVTVTRTAVAETATAPSATPTAGPHFATPEAAMRYLAAAYNAHDEVELAHVTNPSARAALDAMRSGATNLRLTTCTENTGRGDYTCDFDHAFPAGYTPASPNPEGPPPDGSSGGWAQFTVAPATAPGWYMTVLESCD